MGAEKPAEHCHVEITREADGALHLVSVEGAVCGAMSHGGAGTGVGDLRFPPATYVGPVTWELDGSGPFFRHAGRACPKAKTS